MTTSFLVFILFSFFYMRGAFLDWWSVLCVLRGSSSACTYTLLFALSVFYFLWCRGVMMVCSSGDFLHYIRSISAFTSSTWMFRVFHSLLPQSCFSLVFGVSSFGILFSSSRSCSFNNFFLKTFVCTWGRQMCGTVFFGSR